MLALIISDNSSSVGTFQTFNYQDPAVINYQLLYTSSGVTLQAITEFAPAGLTANQKAIGQYFDTIQSAGGTAGLAPFVADLTNIPDVPTLGTAYDQMGPYVYDNTTQAGIQLNQQFLQDLQTHMNLVRLARSSGQELAEDEKGVWFNEFLSNGGGSGVIPMDNYTYQGNGQIMGWDHFLTDKTLVGFSVEYNQLHLQPGPDNLAGTSLSMYGTTWGSERAYVESIVSYSSLSFNNQRDFMAGQSAELANSSHEGQSLNASLGGGYLVPVKNWSVNTSTAIELINQSESEFTETGAGAVDLIVQPRQAQTLFAKLGLDATREFTTRDGKFLTDFGMTYIRNIGYNGRDITASFTDFPTATFTVQGQPLQPDSIAVQSGFTKFTTYGYSFGLEYTGQWNEAYQSNNLSVKISF